MIDAHTEAWARIQADARPEVQASRARLREAREVYDLERQRPGANLREARKRFARVEREHRALLHAVVYPWTR